MSDYEESEYPRNTVNIVDEPPRTGEAPRIIRGALYRHQRQRDGFTTGEVYIGASVGFGPYNLISLKDGNRWSDSPDGNVPEYFIRVVPGADITLKVGE